MLETISSSSSQNHPYFLQGLFVKKKVVSRRFKKESRSKYNWIHYEEYQDRVLCPCYAMYTSMPSKGSAKQMIKSKLPLSKQALQTGKMHFANRRNLTHKKSDCYGDALDVTIKKQSKQKILGNHCLLNS